MSLTHQQPNPIGKNYLTLDNGVTITYLVGKGITRDANNLLDYDDRKLWLSSNRV
jgi:hypothetical protein